MARRYTRELARFARETRSARHAIRLIRIRLSLSKVGNVVCPHSIVADVGLRSLGQAVRLRSHTTDISVLKEILLGGSYAAASEHARKPVATIVDLGANTGLAALWLLSQHPSARIICVEPAPDNAALLRWNVRATARAIVVQACVGARPRRVAIASSSGEWGYAMHENGRPGVEVDCITLDSVLAAGGFKYIDLLKCDIEGAERELFASCAGWIRRVGLATVECHEGFSGSDLTRLIAQNGGDFEVIERQPNAVRPFETITLVNRRYVREPISGRP